MTTRLSETTETSSAPLVLEALDAAASVALAELDEECELEEDDDAARAAALDVVLAVAIAEDRLADLEVLLEIGLVTLALYGYELSCEVEGVEGGRLTRWWLLLLLLLSRHPPRTRWKSLKSISSNRALRDK